MNKRHYEHTLPNIRGSLSNTYKTLTNLSIFPALFISALEIWINSLILVYATQK